LLDESKNFYNFAPELKTIMVNTSYFNQFCTELSAQTILSGNEKFSLKYLVGNEIMLERERERERWSPDI
jgi:hypothetical protein